MCYPLTFEEFLWAAQQPLLVKAFDELNLSKVAHEKLFFFDIGLLGHLLGLSYNEHREQGFRYEGYIAENFVQNELVAQRSGPTYSWEYARSEIEFIFKSSTEALIPIEVKSRKRTRAKSLSVHVQRYSPQKTIKLVGSTSSVDDPRALVLPLYFASKVRRVA